MGIDLKDARMPGEIPDGEHPARIVEAEIKDTKKGDGQYVKIKLQLEDINESVIDMFNFKNPNPEAVRIGRGQLKGLLVAGGYKNPDMLADVWDLINMRVIVRTKMESDKYGTKAAVKGYKPIATATAGTPDKDLAGKDPFA